MGSRRADPGTFPSERAAAARFPELADAIAHRWTVDRDTWLGPSELEVVRAFLAAGGVATRALPDGSFAVEDGSAQAVSPARLFVVALRRLARGIAGSGRPALASSACEPSHASRSPGSRPSSSAVPRASGSST